MFVPATQAAVQGGSELHGEKNMQVAPLWLLGILAAPAARSIPSVQGAMSIPVHAACRHR